MRSLADVSVGAAATSDEAPRTAANTPEISIAGQFD
jgi:hypothetical protein